MEWGAKDIKKSREPDKERIRERERERGQLEEEEGQRKLCSSGQGSKLRFFWFSLGSPSLLNAHSSHVDDDHEGVEYGVS